LAVAILAAKAKRTAPASELKGWVPVVSEKGYMFGVKVMASSQAQFIQRTYQQPYRSAAQGNAGLRDRADSYHEFIWALARKFTNSQPEAEAAAQEDVCRYSEIFQPGSSN